MIISAGAECDCYAVFFSAPRKLCRVTVRYNAVRCTMDENDARCAAEMEVPTG